MKSLKKQRAFLKWAGGKYLLVDKIIKYLPKGNLLIEPFVGAGSVFLNSHYQHYILADINQDLITLFKIIKQDPNQFINDVKPLFIADHNQRDAYYELRQQFNQTNDSYQKALLFFYLNRHGYNGLCRYNQKGAFNVPFGQHKSIYFPEKEIMHFSNKAKQAEFICASYDEVMNNAPKKSVVYCDPPYAPLSNSSNFTAYYSLNFDNNEQQKLAYLALKLSQQNIPVMISNNDTKETREWYQDAIIRTVKTRRSISCKGQGRKNINELLVLYR